MKKVFTEKEIAYGQKKGFEHLATTFAAKEAIFKALGTGWTDGQEIEIIRDKTGRPNAYLKGELKKTIKNNTILLSLSYNSHSALAFAIIKK